MHTQIAHSLVKGQHGYITYRNTYQILIWTKRQNMPEKFVVKRNNKALTGRVQPRTLRIGMVLNLFQPLDLLVSLG